MQTAAHVQQRVFLVLHVAVADHRRAVDAGVPSAVLCQGFLGLIVPLVLLQSLLEAPPRTAGKTVVRRHSAGPSV